MDLLASTQPISTEIALPDIASPEIASSEITTAKINPAETAKSIANNPILTDPGFNQSLVLADFIFLGPEYIDFNVKVGPSNNSSMHK